MTRHVLKQVFLLLSILPISSAVQAASPTETGGKTAINISFVGDDQLTQTLVASLEASLVATGSYELVSEGKQKIQLVVPGHLYWKTVGNRTNFHYVIVMVGSGSRYLGAIDGSCWFDQVDVCSKSIISEVAKGDALGR